MSAHHRHASPRPNVDRFFDTIQSASEQLKAALTDQEGPAANLRGIDDLPDLSGRQLGNCLRI